MRLAKKSCCVCVNAMDPVPVNAKSTCGQCFNSGGSKFKKASDRQLKARDIDPAWVNWTGKGEVNEDDRY